MTYFLGILEKKGIDAISEYSRLIAEVINNINLIPINKFFKAIET